MSTVMLQRLRDVAGVDRGVGRGRGDGTLDLADVHCKTAAVDAEVDGLHGSPLGGSTLPQPRLAPRGRAVVGHVVVQSQERQQRAQDALSRPGRQTDNASTRTTPSRRRSPWAWCLA